jgi:hypothetical protein
MSRFLLRENYIIFELEGIKASDKIIKIDQISARKHALDYKEFKNQLNPQIASEYSRFEYIISLIKIDQIKHSIYFYSPLSFVNKSDKKLTITLKRKGIENLTTLLDSEETLGIPYQFFDGLIQFEYETFQPLTFEIKILMKN